MTNLIRFYILFFIIVMVSVSFLPEKNYSPMSVPTPVIMSTPLARVPTSQPTPINLVDQLGMHSTREDCWIAISGHIYDITSFIGSHPGGDVALVSYCGRNATSAFDTKDKKVPSSHSQLAKDMLNNYLLQ